LHHQVFDNLLLLADRRNRSASHLPYCAPETTFSLPRGRESAETFSTRSDIMAATTSPTRQKWEGRWDQLVGKAKKAWGDLTDDDIMKAKGDYEELLGQIKTRTGRTREEIEKMLDE